MSEEQLEKALREALGREAAPPDFAAKVLTKAGVSKVRPWVKKPVALALAAAIAAIAIVPSVVADFEKREDRARGLKAKQDLLTALAITRDQFRQAKEKIQRTTRDAQ